jgi:hypothetical protein
MARKQGAFLLLETKGGYNGYIQQYFETLIDKQTTLKRKFLLSSYLNNYLTQAAAQNGWSIKELDMPLRASKNNSKQKTEVLTANYQI